MTIAARFRERLRINEGDYLKPEIVENEPVLVPPNTVPNPKDACMRSQLNKSLERLWGKGGEAALRAQQ